MLSVPGVLPWLGEHFIEIIAVITGLLYVLFTIKEKVLLWIFGIISSALYIWIFYNSGIYAYTLLYMYYVVIGIYGWYNWSTSDSKDDSGSKLSIKKASGTYVLLSLLIVVVVTLPVYYILKNFSDSDMPFLDAFLTSGGMVATWMLTQKYIDQWIYWIIIDILSCGAMIYKELYMSSFLFLVYTLMAIQGYREWKKLLLHAR